MTAPSTINHSAVGAKDFSPLRQPVLPLVRLVSLLYLAGPFPDVAAVLDELREPIETNTAFYENPGQFLQDYLPILEDLNGLKKPRPFPRLILDERLEPLEPFAGISYWVEHQCLTRELERINSVLCGPCGCTLCCTGPSAGMKQMFFEIPLQDTEIDPFALDRIDSSVSRSQTSLTEPPLQSRNAPFYQGPAALYHWQNGWSLILPRASVCPQLEASSGMCRIYQDRPDVCRRPQIFPYILERTPERDESRDGKRWPAYQTQNKLLAIWDCPYVREFQKEIGEYATACELELIFKENKT